ncbi:ferredoxin-fold anticodon-binding domain-containing protein 1 isoform X2 [Ascaphus truei]|uniref:ferredoxin-fold anticodon-binding domain-containing protein 1 isoform X2 n=1 Tax=Ascaphus truei TaxID=8439 RepID=UPI003F59AE17
MVHNILLVGEGNFSFSVSLCESSHGECHLTATCYDSEDAVSRQPLAWCNVQHLRDRGAVVHFGVDATRLMDQALSVNKPYDRVIFNFPHCGRKAGVKKNRDLLTKFFRSCADVLAQEGDIHVALCKGQGGTPEDRPMREWHNSWQVVAMAAKAGFILSAVVPFGSDHYSGYQCTGYRSQEKSFHVAGARNHIFTRSLPLEDIIPLNLISTLLPSFQTPEEFEGKIHRGFLERDACHPVSILKEELLAIIGNSLTLNSLEDTFPLICETRKGPAFPWSSGTQGNLHCVSIKEGEVCSRYSCDVGEKQRCSHREDSEKNHHPIHGGHTDQITRLYYLRPSLAHFIEEVIERPDFAPSSLYVLSGLVFKKCLISRWTMPVHHETLILWGYRSDTLTAKLQLLMDTIENAMASILASISKETMVSVHKELEKREANVKDNSLRFCRQDNGVYYTINMSAPAFEHGDQNIGTIMTVTPGQISKDFGLLLVTLNLDLMTMCLLDIPDWRILWTPDDRFIQQFSQRKLRPFQSFSLHPPYYMHDISFWVAEGTVFDDLEFHVIAQRVSKGSIADLQLLDQFDNAQTGQISLCYRVTYQSCDRALCNEQASEMQLLLREELQKCLHITIR